MATATAMPANMRNITAEPAPAGEAVTAGRNARIAVIIVNYRTPALALQCLAALAPERETLPDLEALIVDGGSGDGSAEQLRDGIADPRFAGWATLLPLDFNGGFGWANNQAMLRLMQSDQPPDYVHLLNPDALIEPGAVVRLVETLRAQPRVAAAGSQLLEADGRLAGSAFRFPTVAREFVRGAGTPALGRLLGIAPLLARRDAAGPVDWVTGASVLLRATALRETGLFDDGFFLYFEEVELMHRLRRAGWEIWHVPASLVTHLEGAATGVAGGAQTGTRPLPGYWFQSRRRFFCRAYGSGAARAAGVAWLAGNLLWRLRGLLGLGRNGGPAPSEMRDLLRHGLAATASDREPAIVRWTDAPGARPAWIRR